LTPTPPNAALRDPCVYGPSRSTAAQAVSRFALALQPVPSRSVAIRDPYRLEVTHDFHNRPNSAAGSAEPCLPSDDCIPQEQSSRRSHGGRALGRRSDRPGRPSWDARLTAAAFPRRRRRSQRWPSSAPTRRFSRLGHAGAAPPSRQPHRAPARSERERSGLLRAPPNSGPALTCSSMPPLTHR
jgi:hypothetical protein